MLQVLVVHGNELESQKVTKALSFAVIPSNISIVRSSISVAGLRWSFNLLVVDYTTDKDFRLISRLRKRRPELTIILLAPKNAGGQISRALDAGANGFINNDESANPESWRKKLEGVWGRNHPLLNHEKEEEV